MYVFVCVCVCVCFFFLMTHVVMLFTSFMLVLLSMSLLFALYMAFANVRGIVRISAVAVVTGVFAVS